MRSNSKQYFILFLREELCTHFAYGTWNVFANFPTLPQKDLSGFAFRLFMLRWLFLFITKICMINVQDILTLYVRAVLKLLMQNKEFTFSDFKQAFLIWDL